MAAIPKLVARYVLPKADPVTAFIATKTSLYAATASGKSAICHSTYSASLKAMHCPPEPVSSPAVEST